MASLLRGTGVVLGALLAFAVGCGSPARPHLVLLMIDTLRPDHLGLYGYPRPTSPQLDQLAEAGIVFERAVAPSSWTKPSVASLFTSRLPSDHGAVTFDHHLGDELPTLAERLREAGYRTLGVSGNPVHVGDVTGLSRGFETWRPLMPRDLASGSRSEAAAGRPQRPRLRSPTAAEVNRAVLELLPPRDGRPFFLYVHYVDPHVPYAPPARFRDMFVTDAAVHEGAPTASSEYLIELASGRASADADERRRLLDLYDAEIAAVDHAIGVLVQVLREEYDDELVVAVVSDHGEEFDEHGGWIHGATLHWESLAIPFVIRDFRASGPGERRDEPVDLLDVPTTLLDLAGVEPSPGMSGRPLLAGAPGPRDLIAELHRDPHFEDHIAARTHERSLSRWPWKVILNRDGTRAVYRSDRDLKEQRPLAEGEGAPPPQLEEALAALRERLPHREPETAGSELDAESVEALRALGYLE